MSFTLPSKILYTTSDPSILCSPCSSHMWTGYTVCIVGISNERIRAMHQYRASSLSCLLAQRLTLV